MDILTNNIDRGEYKIRVHQGILLGKGNIKIPIIDINKR
jgi:hypothetical protein